MQAQDIEVIAKAPLLATNGGISLSQIGNYTPKDASTSKEPYSVYLSGNINFNILSVVNLPLSFAYTNNQLNSQATLPFNRFSIAPSYKWVKVYAGYSSMMFSPYTLAGHEIFGGGIELSPENGWKISAIYGRLKKSVQGDSINRNMSSYRRMGGGLHVEYSNKLADVGVNVFKAKDDIHSLPLITDTIAPAPYDNLAGGAYLSLKIIDNFRFRAEYAISALNQDISKDSAAVRFSDRILIRGGDMAVHHAIKTNISQTSVVGVVGVTYERVSPNYNTLGTYYMINDFENITANFSTSVKNFFNIALDGGYQRDNLKEQKNNTSSRVILSGNISTVIAKKFSLGAALSNVQSYVHIRDIYSQITETNEFENLDTLNFTQLNYTGTLNASYLIQSNQETRQSVNAGFTIQKAAEKQEESSHYTGNSIYNTVVSYQFTKIPRKFNASTSVSYNYNQMPDAYMGVMSYNLSLQKAFLENMKTSFIGTYSNTSNAEGIIANVWNLRITGGYTFQKKHNFNLSLAAIFNEGRQRTVMQYSANLSYSYIFSFSVNRKNKKLNMEHSF